MSAFQRTFLQPRIKLKPNLFSVYFDIIWKMEAKYFSARQQWKYRRALCGWVVRDNPATAAARESTLNFQSRSAIKRIWRFGRASNLQSIYRGW